MAKKTCPHCGTSMESSRTICPVCRMVLTEKSSLSPRLLIGGIIVVVVIVAAVLLMGQSPQPATIPNPAITVPPTKADAPAPAEPACTIAVAGTKVPPSQIQLEVMTNQCSAGDISELSVSINGAQTGTMGASPGTSKTFAGTSGTNTVIVVAKFASGADRVVYENAVL